MSSSEAKKSSVEWSALRFDQPVFALHFGFHDPELSKCPLVAGNDLPKLGKQIQQWMISLASSHDCLNCSYCSKISRREGSKEWCTRHPEGKGAELRKTPIAYWKQRWALGMYRLADIQLYSVKLSSAPEYTGGPEFYFAPFPAAGVQLQIGACVWAMHWLRNKEPSLEQFLTSGKLVLE